MKEPSIPPATQRELSNPASKGGRHTQMVKTATSLIAHGLSPDAVFVQLRSMYDTDVSDSEISNIIKWASSKNWPSKKSYTHKIHSQKITHTKFNPEEKAKAFLKGFSCTEADLWEASPWHPLEDWRYDSLMFLAGMYHEEEKINIVTYYIEDHGKANPRGFGETKTRDEWMKYIRVHGTPQNEGGAWIRMNPTDGKGIADKNITSYRFALLEFDCLPLTTQISVLAKLPLPINAILLSGGKSAHAWVRIHAKDLEAYRKTVREMLAILKPLGIDQSNKNPSRLSRLVGAQRIIGKNGDGRQRLLYLNPDNTHSGAIL